MEFSNLTDLWRYVNSKPAVLLTPKEAEYIQIHFGEKDLTDVPVWMPEKQPWIDCLIGYSSCYVKNSTAANNETFEIFLAIDQRIGLMSDAEYVKTLLENYAFDILLNNKLVKVRILVEYAQLNLVIGV